jgi:LacI family transcriptional regulator
MATIKDVAVSAEVSVGTVSKVLSGDLTVKKPLRDRVMNAVAQLGYRPNLAARALRTNRVDVIGLVVPDISNPFFAQLAKAIETEAAKRGHTVMLANSHDDRATERRQLLALLDRAPRGIVVCAVSDEGLMDLESDTPILSLDRRLHNFPLISTDHAEGSAQIADHLFALGHRRIAYIAGPQETSVGRARLAGFQTRIDQLQQRDPVLSLTTHEGHFGYQAGEDIARLIFAGPAAARPTAIATASDQLAIGVLRCARDMGIDVPGDVSVAGFDDIELAALVVPRLTTLRQPTARLAEKAIAALFGAPEDMVDVLLPGELIVRRSTGAPKG